MIKVCKKKAIDRWSKIGLGLWYSWCLSIPFSIIPIIIGFIITDGLLVGAFIINLIVGGSFLLVFIGEGRKTIFSIIKEKQKLFGWNEDC